MKYDNLIYLFSYFLQSNEYALDDLQKEAIGIKMNPVQLAVNLESLPALVSLLRYIQELCYKHKEDKEKGKLTAKIRKIMHVPDGDKSLMLSILSNQQFFAAHAIVHQIENYIQAGDSIAIQKSILKNMKSSKLSKDTVSSIKKLNPKEKLSVFKMFKSFIHVFCLWFPFKSTPIGGDIVTDTLLVKDLHEEWSSFTSAPTNTTILAQNNSEGLFLKLCLPVQAVVH